ncbi:MAG: hypothetical protein VKP62_05210 [Candidatus Sericytochromatia bacterium]|nr:hypothetical protein [Candidatus Sericytochromatia bacterium]
MSRDRNSLQGRLCLMALLCLGGPLFACVQPASLSEQGVGRVGSLSGPPRRGVEASLINEGGPVFAEVPVPAPTGAVAPLINEGGPVFAVPGRVVLPAYFRGRPADLNVSAEQLGGAKIASVRPASVQSDGRFELLVPRGEGAFMATTVFAQDEYLIRMRSLVKPEEGQRITIDSTSTLVTAKLGQAYQRGLSLNLDTLNDSTQALISNLRAGIPAAEWQRVQLDGDNLHLGRALNAVTSLRPELQTQVEAWEDVLNSQPMRPKAVSAPEPGGPQPK